ncbi:MAG TPA: hypothetical protein VF649_06535 [Sphingomonas sp.]|jgi:hypothetical protein|uniref:hypothetical protein n=1 Tax=Sphingomonas sp. TaxID=28214 RepID=UPI002ED91DB5
MTKPRPALTFAQAVTRIAGLIGYPEAARLVGRSERTVRYWSEDDQDGEPRLQDALSLDLAWRAAGGDGAPILDSYAAQLDVAFADDLACRLELTTDIGLAAQDVGEAIQHALAVTASGASPAMVHRAIAETEEARGRLTSILRRLASFLKPAGVAGAGSVGGAQK